MDIPNRAHCIWDKHPITDWTSTVGCPIRYNPTEVIETKNFTYVIKDRIPSDEAHRYDFVHKPHEYECEGVFCSVECCKAYIVENRSNNDLYDNVRKRTTRRVKVSREQTNARRRSKKVAV